jgi:low temperature requirement protein LtrA
MRSRDPNEAHRVATPLELLFDLCFVVAVAQASSRLHHALAHGDGAHALLAYGLVFFAVWWAWMNFTWFASAYDTDDVPYRLKVLVQIAGVLVLAAGVPRAFDRQDFSLVTAGYLIMRLGLVAHWLRAARADTAHRATALRYVLGLSLCQLGWLLLLLIPRELWLYGWFILAPAEVLVPVWAERAGVTPWHPHHIAERYGLLTLIVLGESVLSATVAIQTALDEGHFSLQLASVIVGGLLLLFSMWWLYFDHPRHLHATGKEAFVWGYGHLLVFAAIAAVGAGLGVATDFATHQTHLSVPEAGACVTLPVAVFVTLTWLLQIRHHFPASAHALAFCSALALILLASFSSFAVPLSGVLMAGLCALCTLSPRARRPSIG